LGEPERVVEGDHGHHGAEAELLGAGRSGRHEQVGRRAQRVGRVAVVLGEEPAVETGAVGPPDEVEQVGDDTFLPRVAVGMGEGESPVLHGSLNMLNNMSIAVVRATTRGNGGTTNKPARPRLAALTGLIALALIVSACSGSTKSPPP